MIGESMGELPKIEVVILPFTFRIRDASRVAYQQFLQDLCRKTVHVRADDSKVTRWDDIEDANTFQIRRGNAEWLREHLRLY